MTSTSFSYPLKYFSVGLSSCLHILLAIILFAQTYKYVTQQAPLSQTESGSDEDLEIEFDDYEDIPDIQDTNSEPEMPADKLDVTTNESITPQETIEPGDSASDIVDPLTESSALTEAMADMSPDTMVPSRQVITQRLRSKQSRWRKNTQKISTSEQPSKATAARQLSNHFTNFMYQKQAEASERLARAGGTPETMATMRSDYHRRVLNAIKAATNFFVKDYYASHDFTTPRIHVLFELDNEGNLISVKLEPSSGYQELDNALRNFVRCAKFPKKPQLLTIMTDDPYDFYILPLPVHKGENILKLVAQF